MEEDASFNEKRLTLRSCRRHFFPTNEDNTNNPLASSSAAASDGMREGNSQTKPALVSSYYARRRLRQQQEQQQQQGRQDSSGGREETPTGSSIIKSGDADNSRRLRTNSPPCSRAPSSSAYDNCGQQINQGDALPRSSFFRNTPTARDAERAVTKSMASKTLRKGNKSLYVRTNFSMSNMSSDEESPSTMATNCSMSNMISDEVLLPNMIYIASRDFSSSRDRSLSRAGGEDHHHLETTMKKVKETESSKLIIDEMKEKICKLNIMKDKLRELEWQMQKQSDVEKKSEAKYVSMIGRDNLKLDAMLKEQYTLKHSLSDLGHRLKEYETIEQDMNTLKVEGNGIEEHYQNMLEQLKRQLANADDELGIEKRLNSEKIKSLEEMYSSHHNKHQFEKARFNSIIRNIEDQLSANDHAFSELSVKEKELDDESRSNQELIRNMTNLEKELSKANTRGDEANKLLEEMELALSNHSTTINNYEKEMEMMADEIKQLENDNHKTLKEAQFYQSNLDECRAAWEELQIQVKLERQEQEAVRDFFEVEVNACQHESKKIVQCYEIELDEAQYKNRVLEDTTACDKITIDELRKQLKEYQM